MTIGPHKSMTAAEAAAHRRAGWAVSEAGWVAG
jgi:hypothetical protein